MWIGNVFATGFRNRLQFYGRLTAIQLEIDFIPADFILEGR